MKRFGIGMLVAGVAIVFSMNVSATEVTEKSSVTTKAGTTVEKTEVKGGGVEASETVTTTGDSVTTEEKMKTKGVEMEKERTDTAAGSEGQFKVDVKKGALTELNVDWVYYRQGTEYIVEYTVKDKNDKELLDGLGLTATQADMIKTGTHRIVSTSPYTAGDVKANFQAIILKDLASTIKK